MTYIVVSIVALALFWVFERFRLREYSARSCQGRAWKKAFPTARKQEIREFLNSFVGAFALPRKLKLRLHPDDLPMDIYKAVTLGVDTMEFENFSMDLEQKFGRGLDPRMDVSWSLRDIFASVNRPAEQDDADNPVNSPGNSRNQPDD